MSIIILILVVTFLNCTNPSEDSRSQFKNTLSAMDDEQDTTAVRSTLPDNENPILVEITTEYKWEHEKKNWSRNPFEPIESKQKSMNSRPTQRIVRNETKGLTLTGIIEVNNKRKALINGVLYNIGSKLQNLEILKIEDNSVTLKSPSRTYTLFLKE